MDTVQERFAYRYEYQHIPDKYQPQTRKFPGQHQDRSEPWPRSSCRSSSCPGASFLKALQLCRYLYVRYRKSRRRRLGSSRYRCRGVLLLGRLWLCILLAGSNVHLLWIEKETSYISLTSTGLEISWKVLLSRLERVPSDGS